MILHPPLCITSRLRVGLRVGGAEISIAYYDKQIDGRDRFQYWIDISTQNDRVEHYAHDLSSGCQGCSLVEALASLLAFLTAAGESCSSTMLGHHSDDDDMFPPAVMAWCYRCGDELGVLQTELEEGGHNLLVD